MRGFGAGASLLQGGIWEWLRDLAIENSFVLLMSLAALVRALAITVRTGTTGLFFSFGRARRSVEPGVTFLIPFLQKVVVLPTRARTLDLPGQRVVTEDQLVLEVDVNLVYRIVDVRRAVVEVDELERALPRVLALGVQEVLRRRSGRELLATGGMDDELEGVLTARVEAWGVTVERAGFTSVRPSARTLRVTQLARSVETRLASREGLRELGAPARGAVLLASPGPRLARRAERARRRETERREERRRRAGWWELAGELAGSDPRHRVSLLRRARSVAAGGEVAGRPAATGARAAPGP